MQDVRGAEAAGGVCVCVHVCVRMLASHCGALGGEGKAKGKGAAGLGVSFCFHGFWNLS